MKEIHVNRDGETLGQFSLQEVMAGLASGKFKPSDLAWKPGMDAWSPLNKFPDLDARPEARRHADATLVAGFPGSSLSENVQRKGPDWEKRSELGFFPSLFGTIQRTLMSPSETFSSMKRDGGLGSPLLFYGIISIVVGLVGLVYQMIFGIGLAAAEMGSPDMAEMGGNAALAMFGGSMGLGLGLILLPVMVILGIFIISGIHHLLLMLVGAKPIDFETTFRVCCYGYGAVSVFYLLPICGGIIGGLWGLVLVIIGFAKAHETSTGKAALAVLLPMILCFGLVLVGVFAIPAIFTAGAAAIGAAN